MVNSDTKTCKVCKASFVPLTKKEKDTGICYVCNELSKKTIKDTIDDDFGKELREILVIGKKPTKKKKPDHKKIAKKLKFQLKRRKR
jgi:vacuolar-type H+-ATPase subunit F/Vma7